MKAAELEAERIELAVLAQWLAVRETGMAAKDQRDAIAVMMDFHKAEASGYEGDFEVSGAWSVLARAAALWKSKS